MSEDLSPGYTLPEGTMVPSDVPRGRGSNALYSPQGHPEVIARHPYDMNNPRGHELVADLTDAAFYLQENYGIHTPGIGNTVPESVTVDGEAETHRTFMATNRVEGVNMFSRMDAVPQEVLLATFDAMTRYYEDIASDTSDRLYFTELSLDQCMYGRVPGDDQPRVYDIDIDPWLGNMARGTNPHGPSFDDGVSKLASELLAFKRRFPMADTTILEQRMAGIGQTFGAYIPRY